MSDQIDHLSQLGHYCFGYAYKNAHMAKIDQDKATVDIMVQWMQNPKNLFYFSGSVGTGKTYFAAAWYNYLIEQKKNVRVCTEPLLFSYLQRCMNLGLDPHQELARICETDNFILDDLGTSKPSEWREEMLLTFINHRINLSLPTLITSNLSKSKIKDLYHERLCSRLFAKRNSVLEINGRDRRQD